MSDLSTQPSAAALVIAVDRHLNELFDVVALLEAAADRIESATPRGDGDDAQTMHNTMRLVQMALERVKAATSDLFSNQPLYPSDRSSAEVSHG